MNIKSIGIMQGRLVPREIKSRLQSFPWKNWKKEIILAKKNKIKIIEWTLDYKNFGKNPLIEKPIKTKNFFKRNFIKINSLTADFFMQQPPFDEKNNTTEYLLKLIDISKKINLKYIVIPLVDNSSVRHFKKNRIIKYFKYLQKKINFKKLKIIFELDLPADQVVKFISNFNDSFGINYDIGNSAYYGFKFTNEKKYFSRVYNIHVKDRDKNGQSVPLGSGLANFNEIFSYLKKIKYNGHLILQTYLPKNNKLVVSNTLKNYNFVKSFL